MRFYRWDQEVSTGDTNELLKRLALWHLAQVSAGPVRERYTDYVNRNLFPDLCHFDLDVNLSYNDVYHLGQVLAFFKKRVDLDLGVDPVAEGFVKFLEAEQACVETNDVFKLWSCGRLQFDRDVEAVLYRAQRKIASVLGDVPSLDALEPMFGPGATTTLPKRMASARRKLSQRFACSEDFLPILIEALEDLQGWHDFGNADSVVVPVDIHPGKLRFVPKTAKVSRGIVVEPMLNTMFQLGIGKYLTRRLRRVGLDLSDQSRNQRLARIGSLTGALATLDLSSASDTIATELVHHLLPIDWFLFLRQFRTSTVEYKEHIMKLAKFSSMGNGFTFPLETLIFWSLASACTNAQGQAEVSVYGDDIIVPVESVPLLSKTLNTCGFILNSEKSYWTGNYRESCGKDYLSGIDVRPCYIKTRMLGCDAFRLHNFYVENYMSEPAEIVLSTIDESLRKWGPAGYGDGHLHGDGGLRPYRRPYLPDKMGGWGGYIFDTFVWKGLSKKEILPGDRVLPSYSIYCRQASDLFGFQPLETLQARYAKDGSLFWELPGVKGCKLRSIYTLAP